MTKRFIQWGSLMALLAVALGAFGAHALKGQLSADMMQIYGTAVQYQMFHALGMLVIALMAERTSRKPFLNYALVAMGIGIVLFSGSLYILSLTGIRWLGAITPIGGVGFLVGWLLVILAFRKK